MNAKERQKQLDKEVNIGLVIFYRAFVAIITLLVGFGYMLGNN